MSPKKRRSRPAPRTDRIVISAPISDDASDGEKEGAVRRRLVAVTGRCPCGAVLELPTTIEPGSVKVVRVEHEPGCPAIEVE